MQEAPIDDSSVGKEEWMVQGQHVRDENRVRLVYY